MPKPRAGESRSGFMSRCVPEVIGEGLAQDAAVARCYGIWESKGDDMEKIQQMVVEDDPTRLQTDNISRTGEQAAPESFTLSGSFVADSQEIDPDNPLQRGPSQEELDEILPVE